MQSPVRGEIAGLDEGVDLIKRSLRVGRCAPSALLDPLPSGHDLVGPIRVRHVRGRPVRVERGVGQPAEGLPVTPVPAIRAEQQGRQGQADNHEGDRQPDHASNFDNARENSIRLLSGRLP